MESELKNQEDLLKQLKKLRAENELLEKHVFILNECLSVNELKEKISLLEKKKESLNLLEDTIGRLRAEIEPLKYLKSVLENKLVNENTSNTNKSQACIGLKPINIDYIECEISQSQNLTNIPTTDATNIDLVSSQKSYDHLFPTSSNSVSDVNEISPDDCTQLLDQYDFVTDLETSNFTDENHSQIQNAIKEPTFSVVNRNKVQSEHESGLKIVDLKDVELQMKHEENDSVKENAELSVKTDTTNVNNHSSQDHETDEKSNGSLKIVNVDTNVLNAVVEQHKISNEEDNCRTIKKTTNTYDGTEIADLMYKMNINTFNDMPLHIYILRGIYSLGITSPTTLQKQVIVHGLNGQDIIVSAGSGTGRTLMITIPLLQRIKFKLIADCQALVLVPTRDIAVHIKKFILSVGDFFGVNVCIGGDNVPRKLSVMPHVIVGTPDGVYKMIACRSLRTSCIKTVVVYEIDKMLTDDCINLIKDMLTNLKRNKQVTLFASEKLDRVLDIFMDSLNKPLIIINEDDKKEENDDITKSLPKQFYLTIEDDWKLNAFCEINATLKMQRVIIFCSTLDRAQILFLSLKKLDYSVSLFHLEMSACDRELTLKKFSTDHLQMLITTDPLKGLQFQHAAWIINYDLPSNPICYLNRIGKCVKQTKVLNLINQNEHDTKLIIETYNKSYMIQTPLNILDMLQY